MGASDPVTRGQLSELEYKVEQLEHQIQSLERDTVRILQAFRGEPEIGLLSFPNQMQELTRKIERVGEQVTNMKSELLQVKSDMRFNRLLIILMLILLIVGYIWQIAS